MFLKKHIVNFYNTLSSIPYIYYLLFACLILSFPNYLSIIHSDLDPSWSFFLNYSWNNGFVFGKDVFFTYGPLGWLGFPQNQGNNVYVGSIYWGGYGFVKGMFFF